MAVAVHTPTVTGQAIELGRSMFRKQILKRGQLKYGERTLDFDRPYFDKIAAAFRDRAFDAVPLQLSDEKGAHNNSPLLTRGDVVGVEADDNGLYATVSLTDEGADLVREHPNLGVSVRIVEDFERGDGRSWPAALQHVLACWQPRVAGMSPWEAIEASAPDIAVIDLSGLTFSDSPTTSADSPGDGNSDVPPQEGQPMAPQVTDEELAAIRSVVSLLPTLQKLVAPDEAGSDPTTDDKPTATVTPIVKPVDPKDAPVVTDQDQEAEREIAAAIGEGEGNVIDLAVVELRSVVDRQAVQLAEMQAREDEARWKYESEQLVRDYGIPPAIVALAEPLLKGSKHVVELSQGSVDAGDVIRSVLKTVAKTYGRKIVDLSGPTGTALDSEPDDETKAAQERIFAAARAAGFGQ